MSIFWLTLAVFIVTQAVYIYFIVKYRQRKGVKAVYSHGNNKLEIIWTMIPAAIFIVLAVVQRQDVVRAARQGTGGFAAHRPRGVSIRLPHPQPRRGRQAGQIRHQLDGDGHEQLRPRHAASRPGVRTTTFQTENQITLPVDRPVNIILRSQDVIHAFYVPEFRMYQDIVPGMTINWVWFVPEKEGHYALACNQLCGSGHYNMQAGIDVVSQKEYDKLVKEKSAAAIKAHAAPLRLRPPPPRTPGNRACRCCLAPLTFQTEHHVSHFTAHAGDFPHDEHAAHGEHHHAGFFRTYVWTHDHKMIGKQYLFASMFFGAISGMLAMALRWQLGFPGKPMPIIGHLARVADEQCDRQRGRLVPARRLQHAGHDARVDHGVFRGHAAADRRVRQFSDSAQDRRAGHGVPVLQRTELLAVPALGRASCSRAFSVPAARRRAVGRATRR